MTGQARYFLPLIYITADLVGTLIGFYLAFRIRFFSIATRIFPVTRGIPEIQPYFQAIVYVALIWLMIFGLLGHYRKRSPSSFDRFYETARGVTIGTLIILATTFFYRGESFSRLVMAYGWMISLIVIFLLRELCYRLELALLRSGLGMKRAVIVGDDRLGRFLGQKLRAQPAWGIEPIGIVGLGENDARLDTAAESDSGEPLPRLGNINDLGGLIERRRIDMLIFSIPPEQNRLVERLILEMDNLNMEYMMIPGTLGLITSRAETFQVEGIPLIRWGRTPLEGYSRVLKRILDITGSLIGLILFLPLLLLLAPLIKLDSRGPVFYRQRRLGRDGREFWILKLRTMKHEPDAPPAWTVDNDPRQTRLGRILRKSNIDEMPQLLNVLMGQMSLVGPRPEQPSFVEKFREGIPRYFQRHRVKSGMTGWAQVNGLRGDTSINERTRYDLYYVENWSLVFDLKIIALTLREMIFGRRIKNNH